MHATTLSRFSALSWCSLTLVACAGGPSPPTRQSPAMTEAPFSLVGVMDNTSAVVVVGRIDRAAPFPLELHHLVGERLEPLPNGTLSFGSDLRVFGLDDLYAGGLTELHHYDGDGFASVPLRNVPPLEERSEFRWDVRSSTREIFVSMTSSWSSGAVLCVGNRAGVDCPATSLSRTPVRLAATDGHLYYQPMEGGLYEVLPDGEEVLRVPGAWRVTRAGSNRVLAETPSTTFLVADDGTMEDLGPGVFAALGPEGALLRVDVTSEFSGRSCPRGISCAPGPGYTQFVLHRREGTTFVEHAHLDLIDTFAERAELVLLPDRRVAFVPYLAGGTYLAPPLP